MITKVQEAVQFLKDKTQSTPEIGLVLGSGLGAFAEKINITHQFKFNEIPHFKSVSVDGHKGNLIFGEVDSKPIVILQGRLHYYEGHKVQDVIFPTQVLCQLGIKKLVLTNSAGGILPEMEPGNFMIIRDHLNLMGFNPLVGPNIKEFGPRFPDMSEAYSSRLSETLISICSNNNIKYHQGIYAAVSGPSYETPAEVQYLKTIGAGAVGMSTAPESIIANHMGIEVCGISCVTNKAAGLSSDKLSHEEVKEVAAKVEEQFKTLLLEFIKLAN